jgi:hypothetical protein
VNKQYGHGDFRDPICRKRGALRFSLLYTWDNGSAL